MPDSFVHSSSSPESRTVTSTSSLSDRSSYNSRSLNSTYSRILSQTLPSIKSRQVQQLGTSRKPGTKVVEAGNANPNFGNSFSRRERKRKAVEELDDGLEDTSEPMNMV
jgi:hypothetical protein